MKAENVSITLICIASLASVVVIPRTTNVTPAVIVVSSSCQREGEDSVFKNELLTLSYLTSGVQSQDSLLYVYWRSLKSICIYPT